MPPRSPPGSVDAHESELTISLTTYSLTKGKAKKAVSALKKDTGPAKTKSIQFLFAPNEENYVLLMNTILDVFKMNDQFKATINKFFSMKIAVPLKKKAQACDVKNYEEYFTEAQKITESKPTGTVLTFVDGKQISETCGKAKKKAHNSVDSDNDEDEDNADGLDNPMEWELACIQILLEKQYSNDYDMSYAWLNPETGNKVPLSPLTMDEWTRAIWYD
ncbi:hypothetical protein BT96DRAFT_937107 [Gymnopus androsaceus JB14]|uniref:Uncharacterized protein n=1 Tax=Gymnopus androsaceus JB14 TaxID=1447944 RepID=A0A6A4I099_9AGAR|nr:hypothetical protein BT96DRAFT_937107 [Gymnopus androsaceus JB14]